MPATVNEIDLSIGFTHTSFVSAIKSGMQNAGLSLIDEIEISATNRDLVYRFDCVGSQPSFQKVNINNTALDVQLFSSWDVNNNTGLGLVDVAGTAFANTTAIRLTSFNSVNKNQVLGVWTPSNPNFGTFYMLGYVSVDWYSPLKATFPNGIYIESKFDFRSSTNNPVNQTNTTLEPLITNSNWNSANLHTGNIDAIRNCPILHRTQRGLVANFNDEFLIFGSNGLNMLQKFTDNGKTYANIIPGRTPGLAVEVV